MTFGSLFSGIGGLELGLEWSGLGHTVWQVEICPKLRNCLAEHWPSVERFSDVREVGASNLRRVDLICGGFPCQDISSAGKRVGLSGARSGLWYEFARIVGELRPSWVVVENVASGASKWVDEVRNNLEQQGYESLPIPLKASYCGAWHRRERLFIIAHSPLTSEGRLPLGAAPQVAESCFNSEPTPYIDGPKLRNESRWRSGTLREGPTFPKNNCSDFNSSGELRQTQGEQQGRYWTCDGSIWTAEPDVARVVHGLPGRVDRERALGNSVVPQCTEVVGHVIQLLDSVL